MCVTLLSLRMVIIGNFADITYKHFTGKHKIILRITSCLLSEHIQCKKNIVIMKKFKYEILTISTHSES